MRPQGTAFADSARNRDSVMSLGSIAHMQYYFARTGLLDGKGAQLAKDKKKGTGSQSEGAAGKENIEPSVSLDSDFGMSSMNLQDGMSSCAISDSGYERSVMESPTEMQDPFLNWSGHAVPPMLPPTVSTYKLKPSYTEPLPDLPVLRRELKEALQSSCKVLEEAQKQTPSSPPGEESNGFYEIQGMHLLDIITLAIRAAKNYYTAHSDHAKLYAIKSEKDLRSDLYQVLDILKRLASRNFRGGLRMLELTGILGWIESIDKLLKEEEAIEEREAAERATWVWREGDWTGKEREREWLFLQSFDVSAEALPPWPDKPCEESAPDEAAATPNAFLSTLQDGQRLVRLHNTLISRSKQKFGEIKTWHTDVAKPYRRAENLRFWLKAAELRFDLHINMPALDVAQGKAWHDFDQAILSWSQGVREELMEEWKAEEKAGSGRLRPPELKVEEDVNGPAMAPQALSGEDEGLQA